MSEAVMARARTGGGRSFYVVMSLVVAAIVLGGFGPSYASSLAPPGLPFWVHLHGAVMLAWILLFTVQTALIRRRALPLHRTLGWSSVGLVVVMVPLGIATNLLAVARGATPPFFTPAMMMASDVADLTLFSMLFTWALVARRRPEWHRRLMLCATVLLTWPAIGRIRLVQGFGLEWIVPLSVGLLLCLALAGPVHDWITRRRVHRAYLWGVGLIFAVQPIHFWLAQLPPLVRFAQDLQAG